MQSVLGKLRGSLRLAAMLMYGAGLRLMASVELRVRDVDLETREIRIRDGKGRRDRVTVLPLAVVDGLRSHLGRVHALYDADVAAGHLPRRSV